MPVLAPVTTTSSEWVLEFVAFMGSPCAAAHAGNSHGMSWYSQYHHERGARGAQ
jgi:hypothetical protein